MSELASESNSAVRSRTWPATTDEEAACAPD
jgi:hypothetical protein